MYFTSCDSIPTKEYTNIKFFISGKLNVYFPFISVAVPTVNPLTIIVTPGIGCFLRSVTLPTIRMYFRCCIEFFTSSLLNTTKCSLISNTSPVPTKHFFKTSKRPSPCTCSDIPFTSFTSSLENKNVYPDCSCKISNTCRRVSFFTSKFIFCWEKEVACTDVKPNTSRKNPIFITRNIFFSHCLRQQHAFNFFFIHL